ncbi:MAG: DNA-binding protein YbiB, partial [Polaromonas sp.]|uniref:DNA-binding protein YbiB n=1 Tax=Polaromonas sp. TaxID=1869339 RepID=UPI0040365FDD
MSIAQYIKVIGRGKDGARPLTREQATDLFGQVLDGNVTDLEIGGFCLAMRIKGETPEEMAGFLDATYQRMLRFPASERPVVVLPSYNGARKLPVLTPLLALLLARQGLPVLVHGTATESSRIFTSDVLSALGIHGLSAIRSIANGEVVFAPTELLCPGLKRLLDVRRAVGLRNPAHSQVKIMKPCLGKALVVSSYTHPEYAISMGQTFELIAADALLLRGTEG